MEAALRALRQLSAGFGSEAAVFQAASLVTDGPEKGAAEYSSAGVRVIEEHEAESDSEVEDNVEAFAPEEVTEVFTWGRASNYQLGFGSTGDEQQIPRLVEFPLRKKVWSISCGRFHSAAVTECGSVFVWGFGGASSRLGLDIHPPSPAQRPTSTAFAGVGFASAAVVEPTALTQFGPGRHHAMKVATGMNHTLALTAAGKLLAWGSNDSGQLGVQGVPTGEGAQARQPVVLKTGPLHNMQVDDIAAGAAHSLCIAGPSQNVFAWGSNAHGALGLGIPPSGPLQVSQPQSLPHLKGARAVAANASSHASVVLVTAHGDALLFGGSLVVAGANPGAAAGKTDARFFVPSRVRRQERPERRSSGGADEWRTQRANQQCPLQSVTLGHEEAFGIDAGGLMWLWSLVGTRPATAEVINLLLPPKPGKALPAAFRSQAQSPSIGPARVTHASSSHGSQQGELTPFLPHGLTPGQEQASLGVSAVAVAGRTGSTWVLDTSSQGQLWQVKRPLKLDGAWTAERCDDLAQIRFLACGPEHQAAIVAYRRPPKRTNEAPATDPCIPVDSRECSIFEPLSDSLPAEKQQGTSLVPTLRQLCEDKLCRILSPRSFGLLCDVAWELNRWQLLDQAFTFLCTNAPLMFSKTHLPTLAQLPVEVLAALEVAARALSADSEVKTEAADNEDALESDLERSLGFFPEATAMADVDAELVDAFGILGLEGVEKFRGLSNAGSWITAASTCLELLAFTEPSTAAGHGIAAREMGLAFGISEVAVAEAGKAEDEFQLPGPADTSEEMHSAPVAGGRRKRRGTGGSSPPDPGQPAKASSPATFSKASPLFGAVQSPQTPTAGPSAGTQDWVQVRSGKNRKSGTALSPKSVACDHAMTPPPAGSQIKQASSKLSLSAEEAMTGRVMRLADFMPPAKGAAKAKVTKSASVKRNAAGAAVLECTSSGPSAMLTAAVKSAQTVTAVKREQGAATPTSSPWAAAAPVPGEDQAAPADFREILEQEKQDKRSRVPAKAQGALRGRNSKAAEAPTCSWGRDVMPSEQPKGKSIHAIQKQEREEEEIRRQQQEILEIEAMFAALEVAEIEEAREEERKSRDEEPQESQKNTGNSLGNKAKDIGKGDTGRYTSDRPRQKWSKASNGWSDSWWWSRDWSGNVDNWNSTGGAWNRAKWQRRSDNCETQGDVQ